jgi:hypothetical protein
MIYVNLQLSLIEFIYNSTEYNKQVSLDPMTKI